jgi:hypothetical protein
MIEQFQFQPVNWGPKSFEKSIDACNSISSKVDVRIAGETA